MRARSYSSLMVVLAALFVLAGTSPASAAPPANNDFANAATIAGLPATVTGTTTDATLQAGEPSAHHINIGTASVWYSWTAPASGATVVDACQSGSDTRLFAAAYTGTQLDALDLVASGGNGGCYFVFDATEDVTYRVAVASPPAGKGEFTLRIRVSDVPGNDHFADAQEISGPSPSTPGTLIGSTIETGEPAENPQPANRFTGADFTTSVWYEWVAPATGPLTVTSNENTMVGVYHGSAVNSLSLVDASFRSISFTATAGTTYYILVAGFSRSVGGFVLDLVPPPDTTPPTVNVTGPAGAVNLTDATFTFHDTEGDISAFSCRLTTTPFDTVAFQPCTSPVTYPALAEGNYQFWVYADDASGNRSLSATNFRAFTVDRTGPVVMVNSGPSGTTGSTASSFAFEANELSTYLCRLDSGSFSACSSPKDYGALGPGPHTFAVRATDLAGNVSASDATRTWTINTATTSTTTQGEVAAGGSVSTDPVATGPTAQVPATASITLPGGGAAQIVQDAVTTTPPDGFSIVGQRFRIAAPDATVAEPLTLSFRLDSSAIPAGTEIDNLTLLRDGSAAADCSGPPGTATPDPCVTSRQLLPDGDVVLTVLSSHASDWFVAIADPIADPVDTTACDAARSDQVRAARGLAAARKGQTSARRNLKKAGKAMKSARKSGRAPKVKRARKTLKASARRLRKAKRKVKSSTVAARNADAAVKTACAS